MNEPLMLDLFSGGGGCSVGYARAGFALRGVDIKPHPDYPFHLAVGDAVMTLRRLLDGRQVTFARQVAPRISHVRQHKIGDFAAIHASPPCPRYSIATPEEYRENHPDLLEPVLDLLREWGGTWVVENVPGAPMPDPVMFCGRAMGLRWFRRHRLFSSSALLMSPGCACGAESPYGVTGDGPEIRDYARNGRKARSIQHAQEVMGIDWMTTWDDLTDAIPPAYCEYIGEQLMAHLELAA